MAIVRLPRDLLKNFLTTPEGKGTPLPFGVPANHLASFFFPLPMSGDPRSLRCEHLRDPHSLLTVTFWLLDNVSSTGEEYHSYLFVFVSYHVTMVSNSSNVQTYSKFKCINNGFSPRNYLNIYDFCAPNLLHSDETNEDFSSHEKYLSYFMNGSLLLEYVYLPILLHEQEATQGQFLSGV